MCCTPPSLRTPCGVTARFWMLWCSYFLVATVEAYHRSGLIDVTWMSRLFGHWAASSERKATVDGRGQELHGHRTGEPSSDVMAKLRPGYSPPITDRAWSSWARRSPNATSLLLGVDEAHSATPAGRLRHGASSTAALDNPAPTGWATVSYKDLSAADHTLDPLQEIVSGTPPEPDSPSVAQSMYDSVAGFANQTLAGLLRQPAVPGVRWLQAVGESGDYPVVYGDLDDQGLDVNAHPLAAPGWVETGPGKGSDESSRPPKIRLHGAPPHKNPTRGNATNVSQCASTDPGEELLYLTADDIQFAQCPPGSYNGLGMEEARRNRTERLRKALCAAKGRGWRGGNFRETQAFRQRGYATFESRLWPKPNKCRKLRDEAWSSVHAKGHAYRPDAVPTWLPKWVNTEAKLEFHQNWKVASTSYPSYLQCSFGGTWEQVPAATASQKDAVIAAAVREPIGRFISAASEMLERALNHWCPQGPCGPSDSFRPGITEWRMRKQTTWLEVAEASSNETGNNETVRLHRLMKALVSDTSCNYYTYACEHLSSQSSFVTQNEGIANNISVIMKLEDLEEGLSQLSGVAGSPRNESCELEHTNRKADKPNEVPIPTSEEMLYILERDEHLMQQLCLVYAQDFICFDYELPEACKGMF